MMENACTRRECLRRCFSLAALGTSVLVSSRGRSADAPSLHPAKYYEKLGDGRTQCRMCPNTCVREPGQNGRCRARGNRDGQYYSLVYGRPCVLALDVVEKCPLYHFGLEGKAFSIATAGCNLACAYCQNWNFSQVGPDEAPNAYALTPQEVVEKAIENRAGAIAYFYTEPTAYWEYMTDIAKLARRNGLRNVMVTAGYINCEPLVEVLPWIDAVTLGLKGWNEDYYRTYIGGELSCVRRTIEILAGTQGLWWEVVNLIIPSLNDSMEEVAAMSAWLRDVAGPERPLHFTRFRPEYRLTRLPMTPTATLTRARETAMQQGLKYVYIGNLPGHQGSNTYCPRCGTMLIERLAFKVLHQALDHGKCCKCGYTIGGIWS